MVTTTETTEIVTKPKLDEIVQPSFKRWLKHLLHMPASKRFFNQQDQHAIAQAVTEAEQGHVGERCVGAVASSACCRRFGDCRLWTGQ